MWNNPLKNRGIFRRTFILYAAIIFLAALIIELYITDTVRENTVRTLQENLVVQARLVSRDISFQEGSPLDGLCGQLKQATGARVTIIALNGKVLGDSDTASSRMENHSRRPEIREASLNGAGMSIRLSDTLKYDLLYVAVKIMRGTRQEGFIRLSVPLTAVDRSINLLRFRIILVVLLVLLGTGVLSLWQVDRIRRLTERIRDFSRSLASGDMGQRLYLEHAGEFDEIAGSLNAMSLELQRSIAAHEDEKRRLNVILRSIPDALFIVEANGVIILSSAASRDLFGDTPLRGKPYVEVIRNAEFLSLMEEVRTTRKPRMAEVRIEFPSERSCVVHASPLFYDEHDRRELSGFVIVFHDITKLKQLEQTRKDFVANISHELKTPITAIIGFSETLLEGALDDREHARTFLQTIKANSERINNLIDDLMTISKLELGVISVKKTPLDIRELADFIMNLLREKAAEKGLMLQTRIASTVTTLEADRDRLIQIMANLVDNAIKFTEKGGVTFGAAEENGKTCLFVQDTGIGVPRGHLARLGERFYRVDPGRSRNMGGTGLGLAIVKHLVKAHGWDMVIESTEGKGTKVKIFVE